MGFHVIYFASLLGIQVFGTIGFSWWTNSSSVLTNPSLLLALRAFGFTQLCPTLPRPYELYNPPGSSIYGISQGGILEWVSRPCTRSFFPRGSSPVCVPSWAQAGLRGPLQIFRTPSVSAAFSSLLLGFPSWAFQHHHLSKLWFLVLQLSEIAGWGWY